jgi:hypothetical protein
MVVVEAADSGDGFDVADEAWHDDEAGMGEPGTEEDPAADER